MKNAIENVEYIINNRHKTRALVVGIFFIIVSVVALDSFINKIIPYIPCRYTMYFFLLFCWWLCWHLNRTKLPKNKKNCVGIVLSITTETDKQKMLLKNDLLKRLEEQVIDFSLDSSVNIMQLGEYQSERFNKTIINNIRNKADKKEVKKLNKLLKAIQGHFYVYGSVKERMDGEKKYFLSLDAFLYNSHINSRSMNFLEYEFSKIWISKISFSEIAEFKGFVFTADSISIATKYIIGIAALFSGDFKKAHSFHSSLFVDPIFNTYCSKMPNFVTIKAKLQSLLAIENLHIAQNYCNNGLIIETKRYLKQSMNFQTTYGALLLRAYIEFLFDKDPRKALNTIHEAKALKKNTPGIDWAWKYSEGFLLMYLEEFYKAIKVYQSIIKKNYPGERINLDQVYNFNEAVLKKEPDKIQSLFILGYLKYAKEANCPAAFKYFEEFLEKATDPKYKLLVDEAKTCFEIIKNTMKV